MRMEGFQRDLHPWSTKYSANRVFITGSSFGKANRAKESASRAAGVPALAELESGDSPWDVTFAVEVSGRSAVSRVSASINKLSKAKGTGDPTCTYMDPGFQCYRPCNGKAMYTYTPTTAGGESRLPLPNSTEVRAGNSVLYNVSSKSHGHQSALARQLGTHNECTDVASNVHEEYESWHEVLAPVRLFMYGSLTRVGLNQALPSLFFCTELWLRSCLDCFCRKDRRSFCEVDRVMSDRCYVAFSFSSRYSNPLPSHPRHCRLVYARTGQLLFQPCGATPSVFWLRVRANRF
jgi:hypothetical protein